MENNGKISIEDVTTTELDPEIQKVRVFIEEVITEQIDQQSIAVLKNIEKDLIAGKIPPEEARGQAARYLSI